MSESSPTRAGGGEPFDAEEFARQTVNSIEHGDVYASLLERRVIRLEEIVAARWPRRRFLRRRLAREIRASVATFDDYIPRGDFRVRRPEAVGQEADDLLDRQRLSWAERDAEEQAETAQQDETRPGEGSLS